MFTNHTLNLLLCLAKKIDLKSISDGNNQTLLHYAVSAQGSLFIEFLLNKGRMQPLINTKDDQGLTPLHYAMINDTLSPPSTLFHYHEKIDRIDSDLFPKSLSGLVSAASSYPEETLFRFTVINKIIKLLIMHGADPQVPDRGGNTPLHYTTEHPMRIITLLDLTKKTGINVNQQNRDGATPLHKAVESGHVYSPLTVAALLKHGASLGIPNNAGETPLDIAKRKKNPDILQLLEENTCKK